MWSKIAAYIPDWTIFVQAGFTLLVPIVLYALHRRLRSVVTGRPSHSGNGSEGRGASAAESPASRESSGPPLSGDYETDLMSMKEAIGGNDDVHFREYEVTPFGVRAVLIYVDGMQEEQLIDTHVLQVLMSDAAQDAEQKPKRPPEELASYFKEKTLPISEITEVTETRRLSEAILTGYTALLAEGMPHALLVGTPKGKTRSIEEPISEALLRGPRVGFTEVLSDNTALLRRQGRTEQMEIKKYVVGNVVKKDLAVVYMKTIVNPDLLQEVERRIAKINLDYIAESGYVEQLIEDDILSPFQQAQNTERPDRVMSALMEGRIALLLDGTPFALIVPVTFSMLLQSPEDYYERWMGGSLLRTLRFFTAFMSLMIPSLYISFISFHPGLIPTELAITIIETRQRVPFPSLIEILILEVSIEILREAGVRLPRPIGSAMGIVGGLIIGEAAVQAGIVSPFLVIVVSVTAIASFSIPMYSAGITLRILRFAGMFFAAVLGIFGTILFFLLLCSHLTKLESFGVPYVTPVSPLRLRDWKDLFIRAPLTLMKRRPAMLKTTREQRRS
ncbi:spore germination protein [Paenibacillus macerans]|uniref:GerA spore germination family protein n=1 Tax=Paenibacillus macerans TaxID=44252 RepID=A0A090ZXQ6_PAEMA|nr:spore germination protein [Paenibacillus macerans]KFN08911.1 GerA spore germination family protein [Paenibacillus macerans]MBS5914360.1 spore germination protein [Paenibacillus macerans]MCY7561077.1 spore germination protein [Paenibacillus macerans]MEC0135819.1 spore germination protein [Paenibacillus macerans]MEC0149257.1 spore germination protein [Paenibacillus macerans]